jgi:MADS-box transcription factor, plant
MDDYVCCLASKLSRFCRVKELVDRYEAATHTKVWTDIQQVTPRLSTEFHASWYLSHTMVCLRQERRAELQQVGQMCELLGRELRFMTVRDGEQYTVPSLELLEHNLEAAMYKVRCEKDRKIGGEINYLENIVRTRALIISNR